MCIVSINQIGHLVPKDNLENMCNNNSDGFGISFIENNEIKTYKTMNKKSFIKKAMDIQNKHYKKSHILIHCRIATHGLTNIENCHPFKVNRSTVFAHNGVLSCVEDDNVLSDTRIFKNTYLKYLRTEFLDDKRMFNAMQDLIGIGNKMVFLTTEKNLKSQVYILNQSEGVLDKGIWYSNTTYKYTYFASNANYIGSYRQAKTMHDPYVNHYSIDDYYTDIEYELNDDDEVYNRIILRDEIAIREIAEANQINISMIEKCDDIDYEEMYMEVYGDSPPIGYVKRENIDQIKLIEDY